jgi:hypothetical protein
MGIFSLFGTIALRTKANVGLKEMFKMCASNFNDRELVWREIEPELIKIIVDLAWKAHPDVFNGKFGQRPSHMTVILVGTTLFLGAAKKEDNPTYLPILLCASAIHNDLLQNQYREPYKNIDIEMFSMYDLNLRLIVSNWEVFSNSTISEEMRKVENYASRI